MTNLNKLSVSLTKHGAHKIAILIEMYDKDAILNNLSGTVQDVNIDKAQARKNLSVEKGVVPSIWNEVKPLGKDAIDGLVLVSIIFSHHELISLMKDASDKQNHTGTITREQFDNIKAFTNFAHIIEELGYSTEHQVDHVRYNLEKLFRIQGIHALVSKLLRLKLVTAGWEQQNSVIEEAVANGFHEALSLSKEQFANWLVTGDLDVIEAEWSKKEDKEFFFEPDDDAPKETFIFRPGHIEKKVGAVDIGAPKAAIKSVLLHNEIQNQLYARLVKQYGEECVGTENQTGNGTSIDVVVRTNDHCWFYEIKTASSVKACIRQAIPQLLEYAYWHGANDKADRLFIVSPKRITAQAEVYLEFLRTEFKLPIYYMQFELDHGHNP